MSGDADLSRVGELLADRARCRMLLAMLSGQELTASALAGEGGVSRSTASAHLRKLTDGGIAMYYNKKLLDDAGVTPEQVSSLVWAPGGAAGAARAGAAGDAGAAMTNAMGR